MKRHAALLVLAVLLAGCRTPMPSLNLFAPYGPSRIPPPPTGSYGASSPYYQRPAQPSSAPSAGLGQHSTIPWRPVGEAQDGADDEQAGAVRLASGEEPVGTSSSSKSSSSLRSRFRGMPLNDATTPAEPKLLKTPDEDPIEITDLPKPPSTPSPATLNRSAANGEGDQGPSGATVKDSQWRSRSRYSLANYGG